MSFQTTFKRYELKYLLTIEQKEKVLLAMNNYMKLDQYGRTIIKNLYFDTETYLLVRRSIEKPVYKEKIRMRSYGPINSDDLVFVELKKKYKGIVYKRRITKPYNHAITWLLGKKQDNEHTQIANEIDYFIHFYGKLYPSVLLSYEREAYYSEDGSDFRVTFDDHILCRQDNLSLDSEVYGVPILPEGMVLMEIKCSKGIPLWMTHILSKEKIYKTSFSKYGTAYKTLVF